MLLAFQLLFLEDFHADLLNDRLELTYLSIRLLQLQVLLKVYVLHLPDLLL